MTDAQRLVDQLIQHEGVRLKPYRDTVGKLTIGCGRNLDDVGISHAEAMLLLEHDLEACIHDLASFPWFVTLDPVRQRVLVDMRFQLGARGIRKFKATLAAVASGDYVQAGDNMLASLWAKQTPNRAHRLARWMKTGSDDE